MGNENNQAKKKYDKYIEADMKNLSLIDAIQNVKKVIMSIGWIFYV